MLSCDPAAIAATSSSYVAAGPLFAQALHSFLAAQCAIAGDQLWPADATDAVLADPNYDFIVVGAGSAGSVVANRLSEVDKWKVLLVEAGGNPTLTTEIPQVFYNNLDTPIDWGYKTQPQVGACRSYATKGCAWPRGKVLGGSSSINGMFYVRANKADYDQWEADGNYGWSYDDVLPYFLKSENYDGERNEDNIKYHGYNGELYVSSNSPNPLEEMIINAAVETGMKKLNHVNGESQMGVTLSDTTIKDGVRFSTARAFLSPIRDRENLHVMKNAQATKILFASGTNIVNGVIVHKDGKEITINVRKELILSAGAINSPQLMLLSGIGPKGHLDDMKIEVKADLPVGENLQDHLFVPVFYTMPGHRSSSSLANITAALTNYMLEKSGPLKDTSPHRVISFHNTTDSSSTMPDVQHHYLISPPSLANLVDIFYKHGMGEEVYKKFLAMNEDAFVIIVYNVLLQPKSSGKIILSSSNPFDPPLIYPNYFEDPEDMATIIRAMRQHSLLLGETDAFREAGFKLEWLEIDACKKFDKSNDEFLECLSREITFSLYHPTSTVKMGPENDERSVVDPELRVRKVKGLRVADASIMPAVVRGNTNAPSIMIGEKAADMIKRFWIDKHTEL